jgi:hypothetical protein
MNCAPPPSTQPAPLSFPPIHPAALPRPSSKGLHIKDGYHFGPCTITVSLSSGEAAVRFHHAALYELCAAPPLSQLPFHSRQSILRLCRAPSLSNAVKLRIIFFVPLSFRVFFNCQLTCNRAFQAINRVLKHALTNFMHAKGTGNLPVFLLVGFPASFLCCLQSIIF